MRFKIASVILISSLSSLLFPPSQGKSATLAGFVKDIRNGETLSYVNVILEGEKYGTVSDKNGYYVISDLPSGKHVVVFSMMGYQKLEEDITLKSGEVLTLDAFLEPAIIPMRELVVSAERERFKHEVDVGLKHMGLRMLKSVPGFLEQDLLTSLDALPGVVSVSDFNNALYIRGGEPDQTLILLDGMTIYNPYHVGGIFSTLNIDAIKSADLLAGGFPAEFGGRISSVLNVETKTGNTNEFHGKGDISLISSKLLLEGPINRGSWFISARRTYLDKIWDLFSDERWPTYFYDFYSKLNFDLSDNLKVAVSGFFSKDVILPEPPAWQPTYYTWGNHALSLKFQYIPSPKVLFTFLFKKNGYRSRTFVEPGTEFKAKTDDTGIKGDISYLASSQHSLKLGFDMSKLGLMGKGLLEFDPLVDYDTSADYLAFYVQDKFKPNESMIVNAGVRANYWGAGKYFRISPRLSLKYFWRDDLAIKSAYGHYYQFMSVPPFEEKTMAKLPSLMLQCWYPSNETIRPLRATHYVLGIQKWLSSGTSLDIEGYYKDMANLLELKQISGEQEVFDVGTGYALGLEFLLKRNNSWIGYTYAITRRNIGGITFFPVHDCRHRFNATWNFEFKGDWDFGIRWIYASGLPYTGVVGKYKALRLSTDWFHGINYPLPDESLVWKNMYGWKCGVRYPPYHRMDFILIKRFKVRNNDASFYLQIFNVYNHQNVLDYHYHHYHGSRKEATHMLPILPSIGICVDF